MKAFEDCLAFIEDQLGVYLLDWQKESLRMIYENKSYYFISGGRCCGRTIFKKAAELLEEMKKENDNALSKLQQRNDR